MKTLNNYINEWRANTSTISSIEKKKIAIQYFVYLITDDERIKIFDKDWNQFNDYKDSVYINGKHIEIDDDGFTINTYNPGTYNVYIENINNITNCGFMFSDCKRLIKVPMFNTKKVKDMIGMFAGCKNLEEVPELNTSNVNNMYEMFINCNNLSEETKQKWSKVYNFEKGTKRE